jgi:hypothetical protein
MEIPGSCPQEAGFWVSTGVTKPASLGIPKAWRGDGGLALSDLFVKLPTNAILHRIAGGA